MSLRNIKITREFCQEVFDYMFFTDLPFQCEASIGLDVMKHIYKDTKRRRNGIFNDLIDIIYKKSIIAINNAFYQI